MTDLLWQVGALAGVVIAGLLAWVRAMNKAEQRGKDKAHADAAIDTQDRLDRAREAVSRGRASGADPDKRVRDNDGRW